MHLSVFITFREMSVEKDMKKSSSQAFPLELSTRTFHLRCRYLICDLQCCITTYIYLHCTLCPCIYFCTHLLYDIPFSQHCDVNIRLWVKNLKNLTLLSQVRYTKQRVHLKIIIWQEERNFKRRLTQNIQEFSRVFYIPALPHIFLKGHQHLNSYCECT